MNTKIRVYDIIWDTTDEETENENVKLPTVVDITIEGCWDENIISEYLSDEYGYCHYGFKYEVVKNN